VKAAAEKKFGLFRTIVHTNHGMPEAVVSDFRGKGLAWCEEAVPGASVLVEKYNLSFPERVEQHDMSEAERLTGWRPAVGFKEFLVDLKARDARGEDIRSLWASGYLSLGK